MYISELRVREMADSEKVFNERKQVKSDLRELMGYLIPIVIAIVLATVLNKFVLINARIPSGSMENTIQIGDRIVGFRLAYKNASPQRGEIIMFEHPDHPDDPDNILIKRVIGLPGENVRIEDGKVYIDGEYLEEEYLKEEWVNNAGPYEYQVPEGSYFVMGDNRNTSADARFWENTYVTDDLILGKAVFRYWPFDAIGTVK